MSALSDALTVAATSRGWKAFLETRDHDLVWAARKHGVKLVARLSTAGDEVLTLARIVDDDPLDPLVSVLPATAVTIRAELAEVQ